MSNYQQDYLEKKKEAIDIIDNFLKKTKSCKVKPIIIKFQSLNLWNIQQMLLMELSRFEIKSDDDLFEINLWSLIDEVFEYVNYKGDFEKEKEKLINNLTSFKTLVLKM